MIKQDNSIITTALTLNAVIEYFLFWVKKKEKKCSKRFQGWED